jgi:hypothetical protein
MTGGAGVDNFTGTGGNDNITGAAGADVLVGGSGVDNITGGEGADRLTGGIGADTIVLTETTAAVDQVAFVVGAGTTIAQYSAANGSDTVTGFSTTNDIVVFGQTLVAIGGAGGIVYETGALNNAIDATTSVYEIAGALAASGAAGVVAALGTAATNDGIDAGDAMVFISYVTGNIMEVYYFVDASGADVAATELTLVGTFSGITADSFAAANIAAAFV